MSYFLYCYRLNGNLVVNSVTHKKRRNTNGIFSISIITFAPILFHTFKKGTDISPSRTHCHIFKLNTMNFLESNCSYVTLSPGPDENRDLKPVEFFPGRDEVIFNISVSFVRSFCQMITFLK